MRRDFIEKSKRIVIKLGTNILRGDDGNVSLPRIFSFIEDFSFISILGYIFGLAIILIAGHAMYENRKEVFENRRINNDLKKIHSLLSVKKEEYRANKKEEHILRQKGRERSYLIDAYAWKLMNEILLFTTSFQNSQVELIKLIYDGLGLDHYYFELDNKLIKDKFLRNQKVITIKPIPLVPVNTILQVETKMEESSFSNISYYICRIVENNKRVMIPDDTITDYIN